MQDVVITQQIFTGLRQHARTEAGETERGGLRGICHSKTGLRYAEEWCPLPQATLRQACSLQELGRGHTQGDQPSLAGCQSLEDAVAHSSLGPGLGESRGVGVCAPGTTPTTPEPPLVDGLGCQDPWPGPHELPVSALSFFKELFQVSCS